MSDESGIKIDEKIVKRLISKIVTKENVAIRKGTADSVMVKDIRDSIEEEVECSLNQ